MYDRFIDHEYKDGFFFLATIEIRNSENWPVHELEKMECDKMK